MVSIVRPIVEQHSEESAFLWILRENAVCAPHYALNDIAKLDSRIDAHLDGLRVAGNAGWEILHDDLAREEPGEVFSASVIAFESGDPERINSVLKVGSKSVELQRGIISALGWLPIERAEQYIETFLQAESPSLCRVGVAAAAIHRLDPGIRLRAALNDHDPGLHARALRAIGELGCVGLLSQLTRDVAAADDDVRFWACWSAALLGDMSAVALLKSFFTHPRYAGQAVEVAFRRMDYETSRTWLAEMTRKTDTQRLMAQCLGVVGDSVAVPTLIELMQVPELGRVAGESFSMITGVDIAYEDLEGERPEGFDVGPNDDAADENTDLDPDEDLPWPDPNLVRKWWIQNKNRFRNGVRYLVGRPITNENLLSVLRDGTQRQRIAAALELAIMQPGKPLFETRAPGFRQQHWLREVQTLGVNGTLPSLLSH